MIKSQKVRSLAATTLFTGAACVGVGCASIPKEKDEPPAPSACPPGAEEVMNQLGIRGSNGIWVPPYESRQPTVVVAEGPATARLSSKWGKLPYKTPLYGEYIFRKNHVYGHFTQAQLPNGDLVPVCLELITAKGTGIAKEPGSTSKKTLVRNFLAVLHVSRFD